MTSNPIILDHVEEILIDPNNAPFTNYQAFKSSFEGIKSLAFMVRELESRYIADDPHAEHVSYNFSSNIPSIVPCAFNWFSITLVNYLRLIGLVQFIEVNSWKSTDLADPANHKQIAAHCTAYVKSVTPDLYCWRNKVAAHFAATDPFHNDNLGTLEQSIMSIVEFQYPYFYVGVGKWTSNGETSQLPNWALTKVYEELRARLWPNDYLPPSKS